MKRNLLPWVAALALTLTLLPGLAGAAFSDVSDSETAREVEVLRMMEVLDGYPDGTFQPYGTLTRAQFCKMAVTLMGKGDSVGQFQSYTIFPDVRASYWAAGYINLATRGENKLIAGYPDGTFQPGAPITYGQAVTILMRLLGYTDGDVGAVWPDGYLAVAAKSGVTQNLGELAGDGPITRAQTARLFVNLLAAKGKESSTPYGETLAASAKKDVILLDADAKADDGTEHAVKTTDGTYKIRDRQASPLLAGSKGDLLLDKDGKVLTFIPTRGATSQTITMVTAKGDKLLDVTGQEYAVKGDTPVYQNDKTTTYGEIFKTLNSGQVVTIFYTPAGAADYLFLGGVTSEDAVVVSENGSASGFGTLAGSNNYTIYKNGVKATADDLRKNDVAVYDSAARAIRVSDTKLTGVYESVYPNREAPSQISLMGAEFPVLPSAAASLSSFRLGDRFTLLLTHDNHVAGAMKAEGQSNAVGVVTAISKEEAKVDLLGGLTLSGDPGISAERAKEYEGQLVRVSSSGRGKLSLSILSAGSSGEMNVSARTVGGADLAPNVRIYERVKTSAAYPVMLEDLTMDKIPSSQVDYVRRDWAGRVDLLVLNDATGDQYQYGTIRFTDAEGGNDSKDMSDVGTPATISLTNGEGTFGPYTSLSGYKNRSYGGLIATAGGEKLAKVVELKKLGTVKADAWSKDDKVVTVNGTDYPVPEGVQCYNRSSQRWTTLAAARSFGDSFELYADKTPQEGGKIRVLLVGE